MCVCAEKYFVLLKVSSEGIDDIFAELGLDGPSLPSLPLGGVNDDKASPDNGDSIVDALLGDDDFLNGSDYAAPSTETLTGRGSTVNTASAPVETPDGGVDGEEYGYDYDDDVADDVRLSRTEISAKKFSNYGDDDSSSSSSDEGVVGVGAGEGKGGSSFPVNSNDVSDILQQDAPPKVKETPPPPPPPPASEGKKSFFSDMDLLLPPSGADDGSVGRFEGYDNDGGDRRGRQGGRGKAAVGHVDGRRSGDRSENRSKNRTGNEKQRSSFGERSGERSGDEGEDRSAEYFGELRQEDRSPSEQVAAGRSADRSGDRSGERRAAAMTSSVGDAQAAAVDDLDAVLGALLADDDDNDNYNDANVRGTRGGGGDETSRVVVDDDSVAAVVDVARGGVAKKRGRGASGVDKSVTEEVGRGGGGGGVGDKAEIAGMKVVELKARCKSMGLPVSGKKAELQDRIMKALP